jgi:2,3-bisphosphoglycerate-independent phosphoglycerate mutase
MPKYSLRPVVLLILDGWGVAPIGKGNPLAAASLPKLHELMTLFPVRILRAAGEEVGLPWGEPGNSEVGHLTIGAGRIYKQLMTRITLDIQSGAFFQNKAFIDGFARAKEKNATVHIIGLASSGRVHGSNQHIYALLDMAKQQGVQNVMVHAILDGRDAPKDSGVGFIRELQQQMLQIGVGRLASLMGRFYAMDRDERWNRIKEAYDTLTGADAKLIEDPIAAIEESYKREAFDEEFSPVAIGSGGKPVGTIKDGDVVIMTHVREDRARELVEALTHPFFAKFKRPPLKDVYFIGMTAYGENSRMTHVAFPPEEVKTCIAKVVSEAGLRQFHIAETEKKAHVTYFLNGLREEAFPGEHRVIVPSAEVLTYDQAPAMSVRAIGERVVEELSSGRYDFIVANLCNADMVGHTGSFDATRLGAEAIDTVIGQIAAEVLPRNGMLLVTADHGNGEEVLNPVTGAVDKQHSTNPVPVIIAASSLRTDHPLRTHRAGFVDPASLPTVGTLADIAPTVLTALGLEPPDEMTGTSLI